MGSLRRHLLDLERDIITCHEFLNSVYKEAEAAPGHELELLDELCDALAQHQNAVVRRAAAYVLGHFQRPRGTVPLSMALQDEDSEVRLNAALSLEQIGDRRAVESLCRALSDSEIEVRQLAARALGEIGDSSAVPFLRESLENKNSDVRREVIIALGKLKDPSAFEPLCRLIGEGDWLSRARAIAVLGPLRDPRSLEPLKRAMNLALRAMQRSEGNAEICGTLPAIAKALGEIGNAAFESLCEVLEKGTLDSRTIAVEALAGMRDRRAIVPLAAALADYAVDPHWRAMDAEVQWAAVDALASFGEAAVDPLCEVLANSEPNVRRRASWTLIKIGETAVMPLCRLVQDPSKSDVVRQEAATILGKLQSHAAVEPLCATLEHSSGAVYYAVAQALVELNARCASSPAHPILSDASLHQACRERDIQILAASRWVATPWDYSSSRSLFFGADDVGNALYGYGQTIYTDTTFRWDLSQLGRLRLTYDGSATAPSRDLRYRLTFGVASGSRTLAAGTYQFNWTLELSDSPWPPNVEFSYGVPRVFYGLVTSSTRLDDNSRQSTFSLNLKPGDELFIGPSTNKREAFAHVGIQNGAFTCIDAPFYLEPTSPFDYGHGTTTVPLEAGNTGMRFETNCWGVHRRPMFSIGAVDEQTGTVTLLITIDLVVLPRDGRDHALTAFND
jgi:HEAT repeat protein